MAKILLPWVIISDSLTASHEMPRELSSSSMRTWKFTNHNASIDCNGDFKLPRILRIVRYKQSEYLMPWKWRKKNPVYRFILDIPYALYFSIFPAFGRFRSDRKTWIGVSVPPSTGL